MNKRSSNEILKVAKGLGMKTMQDDIYSKAFNGLINIKEALTLINMN